jgi:SpoVK/Ycf46/Vps4 family AAA+-type ATPase
MKMAILSNCSLDEGLETINRITCRVETEHEKGTGVLIQPQQSGLIYFVTAKHCLLGQDFSKKLDEEKTKIFIPAPSGEKFEEIGLKKADNIIYPNETESDCAIVVFQKKNLPASCGEIPEIDLLERRYTEERCLFRGYPRAYSNIEGINIPVNYSKNDVVMAATPLSNQDADPLYNCMGFSGSGLFCQVNKKVFLIGIIYELHEPFQRLKVCNFSFLNELLSENNFPKLKFHELPMDEIIQKDIQRLSEQSDLILEGINEKIGKDFYLDRKEVINRFQEQFDCNKLMIITGSAGVGKSVLAKIVISKLKKENYFPLAFKSDFFVNDSIKSAFEHIENSLMDIFKNLGQYQQVVILIDSFEKLLEVTTHDALNEFLRICKKFKSIKVLVTCRTHAYQQLIFHFHNDFPSYAAFEIPGLSDNELLRVEDQYPLLKNITGKQSIKKILKRPFYLNLIVLNSQIFQNEKDITESEFREIIWREVISKNNSDREKAFEQIAVARATAMTLYARCEDIQGDIISQLYNDGIIKIEEKLGESYAPAHDIYEDIALIRFIERIFQQQLGIADFFEQCGKEPSKRRAFRLWLNDSLFSIEHSVNSFALQVLRSDDVKQYWKDEVIIAILRSPYCQNFFDLNEEILQEDDFSLFLTFIHLLRTTCQGPDIEALKLSATTENNWFYLTPVGGGWEAVIRFIRKHYQKLSNFKNVIVALLVVDWAKKIRPTMKMPPETDAAANILISLLDEIKERYRRRENDSFASEYFEKAIQLLFNLSSVLTEEVEQLVKEAIDYDESENWEMRAFYKTILRNVLSLFASHELCKELPDLVCEAAKKIWIKSGQTNAASYDTCRWDMEDDFGLTNDFDDRVFPAGIYKTPLLFLLKYHPLKALNLIVDILNHATEVYAKSRRGQRTGIIEVEIETNDGDIIKQKGNKVLWAIYRGVVESTPYLLQSLLMTLESWLFEWCKVNEEQASQLIENTYHFLLTKSTTVATTAVLASAALAYPDKIGKNAFPIIKVKEFFSWDIRRYVGDLNSPAPKDSDIPFAQQERIESNRLPHRRFHLEYLVILLQTRGYWNDVNRILDEMNEQVDNDDTDWRLKLERMDFRNFQPDSSIELPEENMIALKPTISDDLKAIVDEGKHEFEQTNKAAHIFTWDRKAYENEPGTKKSFEKWMEVYDSFKEIKIDRNNTTILRLFGNPIYLAALGLRDFYPELDSKQKEWCFEIVLNLIGEVIEGKMHSPNVSPSAMYLKPAIETLPLILSFEVNGELRYATKAMIFLSLLHLNDHEIEYLFETFRNSLWDIDCQFAEACFAGLIEYSKLDKTKVYLHLTEDEEKKFLKEFSKKKDVLLSTVIKEKVKPDIRNLSFDTSSHRYLVFAALILPYETVKPLHLEYTQSVFQLFSVKISENMKGHNFLAYQKSFRIFLKNKVGFLLKQPEGVAKKTFSKILNNVFYSEPHFSNRKPLEYISSLFQNIISEVDGKNSLSKNMWYLWDVLEEKIRKSNKQFFISSLFLFSRWWKQDAEHWPPLENKKEYFKRLIAELGYLDIASVIRLLSGIGTKTLLPDGINWLRIALDKNSSPEKVLNNRNTFFYCEKLVQKIYYKYLREVKTNRELCQNLIFLLDKMIQFGSSIAYQIREQVISV